MNNPYHNSRKLSVPANVPQIGGVKPPPAFQFIVQVTEEYKAKLNAYTEKSGLSYQQVLNMILEFGLVHLNILITNAEKAVDEVTQEDGPTAQG
jgi:hypothetical protein